LDADLALLSGAELTGFIGSRLCWYAKLTGFIGLRLCWNALLLKLLCWLWNAKLFRPAFWVETRSYSGPRSDDQCDYSF